MITASANRFLLQQTSIGRISPETVSKVTTAWKNKCRPQVIEFQFDQLTQRDLILYNLPTVRFGGRRALNAKHCDGVMLAWRRLGKEMACRTFCAPDSMLRKHLHDAAKLLELLGAPLTTLIAFDELAVRTVRAMDEEQGKRRAWAEAVMGKERVFETPLTPRTPRTLGGDGRAGAGDGSVRKWPVRSGYSEGDLVGKGKNLEVSPFMKYAG